MGQALRSLCFNCSKLFLWGAWWCLQALDLKKYLCVNCTKNILTTVQSTIKLFVLFSSRWWIYWYEFVQFSALSTLQKWQTLTKLEIHIYNGGNSRVFFFFFEMLISLLIFHLYIMFSCWVVHSWRSSFQLHNTPCFQQIKMCLCCGAWSVFQVFLKQNFLAK